VRDFYLAGGTALAFQIGHRISTDLDWFSTERRLLALEREAIRQTLSNSGSFEVASEQLSMPGAAPRWMKTLVVTTLVVLWQTND